MPGKFGVFISMSMIQFYHTVFNGHVIYVCIFFKFTMKPNIQHFTHCYGIDIHNHFRTLVLSFLYRSCDKCRKERKYHCKCNDREYLRSAVTVEKEHYQRIHCFKHFLLEGMLHVHMYNIPAFAHSTYQTYKCDKG
jgi:hypothetical protein